MNIKASDLYRTSKNAFGRYVKDLFQAGFRDALAVKLMKLGRIHKQMIKLTYLPSWI